jgi:hypothetical protein
MKVPPYKSRLHPSEGITVCDPYNEPPAKGAAIPHKPELPLSMTHEYVSLGGWGIGFYKEIDRTSKAPLDFCDMVE